MTTEPEAEARNRVISILDRRVEAWMWEPIAIALEELERGKTLEVPICKNNDGYFYVAQWPTKAELNRFLRVARRLAGHPQPGRAMVSDEPPEGDR